MSSPASLRPFVACPTLAVLVALAGCGNRGELYLEPSVDAAEAEIRRLEIDPYTPLPDDAVAPTADPDVGVAPVAPGTAPDEEEEDGEENDAGDGSAGGRAADGG